MRLTEILARSPGSPPAASSGRIRAERPARESSRDGRSEPSLFAHPLAWAAAWALLVAVALALRPLLPIDETRYATVGWEMWLRRDLLVPHLNGVPYSDKPPLLFWLFQAGWWLFGVHDGWPRLVPPLFGLACLPLTAALARRLWPDRPRVAATAPAVLLGFLLWTLFTTALMFDTLVAFFVLAALLGVIEAWQGSGLRGWLLAGAALGLGLLAKGPVVLLPVALVALLAPWWGGGAVAEGRTGRSRAQGHLRWYLGLLAAVALGVAVALAWALPAAAAGGPAYGSAILLRQTEERLVHSFAHQRPWWWYLPLLPLLLFPYSAWPPLWRGLARLRPWRADLGCRFCLAWLVPGIAAFSAISGKQPHYLLPLLPAAALLISRALVEAPVPRGRQLALPLALLALVGGTLALAPLLARLGNLPQGSSGMAAGGLVVLAAVLAFAVGGERLLARGPEALSLLSLALVAALHLGFAETGERSYDLRPMAGYLAALERQGRPIAFVGPYHGQLHFLGRLERPFAVILPGQEGAWLARHPRGRVIEQGSRSPAHALSEFRQPYRSSFLFVWGRDARPAPYLSGDLRGVPDPRSARGNR